MATGQYTGVSGVARKVKNDYIGIGNVARKVKNGYIGVGGVARKFYQNGVDLYNRGITPYTLKTRGNTGQSTPYGKIDTNCFYLDTTHYLGDTKGNSGLSSHLACPSFVISDVNELRQQNIDKYSKLQVTYEIKQFYSSSRYDTVKICFGGWAGFEWDYDSDLETKGDSYYWRFTSEKPKGTTGIFTETFNISDIKKFLTGTQYCNSSTYKELADNLYLGAYTHVKSGSDYSEWYCYASVYWYEIKLL